LRKEKKSSLGGKKAGRTQELGKGIKAVFGYLGFKVISWICSKLCYDKRKGEGQREKNQIMRRQGKRYFNIVEPRALYDKRRYTKL